MNINKNNKISVQGKQIAVETKLIQGKTIVITGGLLKIASIKDEKCDNGIHNPELIIIELKKTKKTDIFTWDQKIPDKELKFNYYYEWNNFAVLKIKSYEDWWNKKIKNDARRMVRKAEKKRVVVKVVKLTDELVEGIKSIYDETPIRQGKQMWHYKKDFNTVKIENSTYLDRSEFIGAYIKNELIGFAKMFYTDNRADTIQLLSKEKDKDKSPTNALIAKSIEVCANKGITYLTYGRYSYGKVGTDSLKNFKIRNGFEKFDIPRYYVPLTLKGKIVLNLKLHRGIIELLPLPLVRILLKARTKFYFFKYSKKLITRSS